MERLAQRQARPDSANPSSACRASWRTDAAISGSSTRRPPGQGYVVPGEASLVRIDLAANRVAQVIRFDERVAPLSSYINDVRLSPDGRAPSPMPARRAR